MAKKKRQQAKPTEVRIPLGTFPAGAVPSLLGLLGGGALPGRGMTVERIVAANKDLNWMRVAQRRKTIDGGDGPGPRDGVVVALPSAAICPEDAPLVRDLVLLVCVDEHAGTKVDLALDREGARQLIEALQEAVNESGRRAAEAVAR